MTKPRPPEHDEYDSNERKAIALTRMPALMRRKYLRAGPNDYPLFLYKYFSNEIQLDWLKSYLIDSDFYLSSCSDFNDPFDTSAKVINQGNVTQRRKRFEQIARKQAPHLNRHDVQKEVSRMMVNFANNPDSMERIFLKNTQSIGLCCLTETPRNILMWSHYASQHKGIVLQFDVARDPESLLYALPMHYSNDYPIYDIHDDSNDKFNPIMFRKAIDWKYEREWRILRIGGAKTFQPFKPEALTGLIFGCRASDAYKETVYQILQERQAIKYPDIKIYQAVKHQSKYEVQIARCRQPIQRDHHLFQHPNL